MRRVVTGQDGSGKSVFVSDEDVAPVEVKVIPGNAFTQLWGSDDTVSLPTDGRPGEWRGFFPPTAGFRFLVWSLAPESTPIDTSVDIAATMADLAARLPGLFEVNEPDHPGMHTTDTVDWDLVLSGEVWLELDDGAETLLRAGDSVVQNGTRHAWHNRSDAVVTIATAIVGAKRT